MLVLPGQASPAQCLVTLTAMVMLVQRRYGLGGAGGSVVALVVALAVALVVVGGDGDLTDTLGNRF